MTIHSSILIFFSYSASRSLSLSSTLQNTTIIRKKIDWTLKKDFKSHRKHSFHVFSFRDWARYKDFSSFRSACWIRSRRQWRQNKTKRQTSVSSQRKQWDKEAIQIIRNSTKKKICRVQSFHSNNTSSISDEISTTSDYLFEISSSRCVCFSFISSLISFSTSALLDSSTRWWNFFIRFSAKVSLKRASLNSFSR